MRKVFPPEWRTQSRRKRRFYARYMRWLEWAGYVLVAGVLGAFILAFRYPVDDLVTADKVAILPHGENIEWGSDPYYVSRWLVKDFDEVKQGQPIVEIVEGNPGDKEIERWGALESVREKMGDTPEFRALLAKYPRPDVRVFHASKSGTFHRAPSENGWYEGAAGSVVDYNDLRLKATFSGDTVPQAQVGQIAKVTGITVDYGTKALFRGSLGGESLVSGNLLGTDALSTLSPSLSNGTIRLRDDVDMTNEEITDVQVDAKVSAKPASGADAVPLDPTANLAVSAKVVSGMAMGTVQVSDLPPDAQQDVDKAIRAAVVGRKVRRLDGSVVTLDGVSDIRTIFTLKVHPGGQPGYPSIPATKITRTYDAELKIDSPPAYLIEAVKAADRAGKQVTAHVDLRTGTRPIAFILLKKS